MESIRDKVCRRLRELRRQAGLTQEELAAKSELSVDAVRKIEGRRATPTLETLEKIAGVYGITLGELLTIGEKTARQVELEEVYLHLAGRKPADVRFAKKVMLAALETLDSE